MTADRLFYRRKEAACLLGVSVTTLWRWSREGRLPPATQIGPNTSGYELKVLEDFLKSRRAPPNEPQ